MANGSDSPTAPVGPRYGIWAACTRPAAMNGTGKSPYGSKERVGPFDALRMYTSFGAAAMELDSELGTVSPGKWGDLVVWDRNLLKVPIGELHDVRPSMTIVGGEVVFEAR